MYPISDLCYIWAWTRGLPMSENYTFLAQTPGSERINHMFLPFLVVIFLTLSAAQSSPGPTRLGAASAKTRLEELQTVNSLLWFAWAATGLTQRRFSFKTRLWRFINWITWERVWLKAHWFFSSSSSSFKKQHMHTQVFTLTYVCISTLHTDTHTKISLPNVQCYV